MTKMMSENIDISTAVELLKNADKVLILIHQFPDGDTIGCGYSLCRCLQRLGKQARVECNHTINPKFNFIADIAENQNFEPEYVVAVDVADEKLLGEKPEKYKGNIDLCIDHHPSNTMYAKKSLVDGDAAAACEIIYEVALGLCGDVDAQTAAALYTGISTDTGCFKFTNTSARTHIIAAKLIDKGIDFGEINRIMFDTKTKSRILMERLALENMIFANDDRCSLVTITKQMRRQTNATDDDMDGITSLARQVEGVIIGITVRERENNKCKISVRTHDPISASEFCAVFGGGGHARAAGCEIDGDVETARKLLLERAEQMLDGK